MDSGRKTRVIVGVLLGLLFVGIVALGSIFRTVVFTVAAVIAVYEMSNMIYKKTEKNIFAAPAYIFAALCFPVASFPAALAARMSVPGVGDGGRNCHNAPRGAVPDAHCGGEGIQ